MELRARRVAGLLLAILVLAPAAVTGATPVSTAAAAQEPVPERKVDLNTADAIELQRAPGIGPAMAQRILDWREEHGPFERLEDLLDIRGIGEKTLEKLRPWLEVRPADEGSGGRI